MRRNTVEGTRQKEHERWNTGLKEHRTDGTRTSLAEGFPCQGSGRWVNPVTLVAPCPDGGSGQRSGPKAEADPEPGKKIDREKMFKDRLYSFISRQQVSSIDIINAIDQLTLHTIKTGFFVLPRKSITGFFVLCSLVSQMD